MQFGDVVDGVVFLLGANEREGPVSNRHELDEGEEDEEQVRHEGAAASQDGLVAGRGPEVEPHRRHQGDFVLVLDDLRESLHRGLCLFVYLYLILIYICDKIKN